MIFTRESPVRLVGTSAGVCVRAAASADLDGVMGIDRGTLYVSHWKPSDYERYQSRGRDDLFHRCLLVACDGAAVVGFVAGSFLEGNDAAVLENLAVDASRRRQGVSKSLCGALIEWAKAEGATAIELEVRATNEAAQALYTGLRFMENGRRIRYYSDPDEDALLMTLRFV